VTRRPSPSGREERSPRTQKDDETVKGTSVFGKAFSFAGGRGNGDLGQLDKPSPTCSQKERRSAAQRERLQISRGSGLATRRCSAGIEEGSSRNARALQLSSVGPDRFRGSSRKRGIPEASFAGGLRYFPGRGTLLAGSFGSLRVARLLGGGHRANAKERHARKGMPIPIAGEDDGARECARTSYLVTAEVGRRRRSKEAVSQRQLGEARERGPSPRKTILARAKVSIATRHCSHKRKPRSDANATGEAAG